MPTLRSSDAQLFYDITGSGPDVILLHPFPLNHRFWKSLSDQLSKRYRVIMPDLRGHGDSELGEGPATMVKMAADLEALCREQRITRAIFVGVSIGGYILFEFWRRSREHVAALVLANTRAGADTVESRVNRLAVAERVMREGTAGFIDETVSKLMSPVTRGNRPDIVDSARRMMQQMSPQDVAAVQRGMADRSDSVPTLSAINVPTLILAGADDSIPLSDFQLMQQRIAGSRLQVIPGTGHYAALEQPEEFGRLLRGFFDTLPR